MIRRTFPVTFALRTAGLIAEPRPPYRHSIMDYGDIGSIEELGGVAEGSVWQDFEQLTAFIFEENGFRVSVGTVATRNRQRRQYDVIARKNGRTLLVECKRWSGSRYRLSALKRAVLQHRERAQFYEAITKEDAVPVIVVLIEERIRVFDGVPLVPVQRLNAFIGELENCADGYSFAGFEEEEPEEDLPEDIIDVVGGSNVPEPPEIISCPGSDDSPPG